MHIRVKFGKEGAMKFIGHLDVMRYFQKAIRRAGIPVTYTSGYSPHMIMSFASPLGVGITSSGEYFDMEVDSSCSSAEAVRKLNEQMADGMTVCSYRKIPAEKKHKGMSLVAAAEYQVTYRSGKEPESGWQEQLSAFLQQDTITVMKKTKKSEKEIDLRPYIYRAEIDGNTVKLFLSAGSVTNIKPELVMAAFAASLGWEQPDFALLVHRNEMYAWHPDEEQRTIDNLLPLEDLGEEIEDEVRNHEV